jgi:hypothetical protein
LIVNRTTGQSGLLYDASADVGRVTMSTSQSSPTERLTITLEPRLGGGGVFRVAWDEVVAEASFKIVP